MSQFIIAGAVIVVVFVVLIAVSVKAMDDLSDGRFFAAWPGAAFCAWVTVIAFLLYAAKAESDKGPCLHYETQMHWNAATKTMMPARVCVDRGEWVAP
ncbi:hypothetical protein [Pseudomonas mosselii]|uniref:Uncharacterized protein n=1 Tax=Pseudomonas mosselii TaxID=78327 RepID=A0ABX9AWH0_9PSED|nr:hypothetical protein [Pseudomonas mosselii]QZP24185.1 hypothetical protein K5H97_15185 [Pseudomonas mosselii]